MVTTDRGQLHDLEGTAHVDVEDTSASTAALNIRDFTGAADRDGHPTSNDLFDVENHPETTFTSVGRDRADRKITGGFAHEGHHPLGHDPLPGDRQRSGPLWQRPHRR